MLPWVRYATLAGALFFVAGVLFSCDPEQDLTLASRTMAAHDYDQTLRLARRAHMWSFQEEIQARALILMARAAQKLERPDRSLDYLNDLLADQPQHVLALLFRGVLKNHAGLWAQGLADLNRGLALSDAQGEALSRHLAPYLAQRSLAMFHLGQVDASQRQAQAALAADPNEPSAHYVFSLVLAQAGQPLAALEHMEKAMALAQSRDMGFFLSDQGDAWLTWLVRLRMENKVDPTRPYLGNS